MKYILHIGPGKTGSTSLQRALSDNRKSLRRHGVIYPIAATGRYGMLKYRHHRLREILLRGGTPNFADMPVDWVEQFRLETGGADICVLSDEEISLLPERDKNYDPEAITSLIPREHTRVVMYVREPVSYTVSRYQEKLINRNFTKDLRHFAANNRPLFLNMAERWSRVFGRENVMIRLYGRDYGNWDIVSDFADVIGLKRKDAFPNLEGREYESNPGMAGNLLFVKRILNGFITLEENRSIAKEFQELKYLDESFRGKIPVDPETVNLIANHSREQLEDLDRLFGLSVIPRDLPIIAPPCPNHDKLDHDFARIQAWAHAKKGALAPLLERVAGMFTSDVSISNSISQKENLRDDSKPSC